VNDGGIGTHRIEEFLERLASKSPTPGGGTVAALAGASGAALIAMVANLTIDKQGYEAAWERMRELRASADAARGELLELADRDAMAFDAVMQAFRMPKGTDAEKAARVEAIQMAFTGAAAVPMMIEQRAADLIGSARDAVELGNENAASDGASAAYMLFAAVECAAANVAINAAALKDQGRKEELRSHAASLRDRAREAVAGAVGAFDAKVR
jgi:formiminotetrahydrofolate cyclodeaminase